MKVIQFYSQGNGEAEGKICPRYDQKSRLGTQLCDVQTATGRETHDVKMGSYDSTDVRLQRGEEN